MVVFWSVPKSLKKQPFAKQNRTIFREYSNGPLGPHMIGGIMKGQKKGP